MAITCDICGATTDLDETFIKTRKSFSSKKLSYCPACWHNKQTALKPYIWWYIVILIFGIVFLTINPQDGWFFLNLFFTCLCVIIFIIPHELGHAAVTKLLGNRVIKICLGSGRVIKKGTILGFPYELSKFPFIGLTLHVTRSPKWFRLKKFCIVAAGLFVNLSIFLLALSIPQAESLNQMLANSLTPVGWVILANAWILIVNLIPHKIRVLENTFQSDGLSLLTTPFLSSKKIREILPLYYAFEGFEFLQNKQYQQAKTSYLHGLSEYPENNILKNDLGVAYLLIGEFEESRKIFSQLLEKSDRSKKQLHVILLNNLACANLMCDREELLKEADTLSDQVYKSYPWVPAFKGTRGSVLVESGRFDEGIALLKEAMEVNEDPQKKATNASYIAIAEARKGNIESARQYFTTARELDADCQLLDKVQNEINRLKLNIST